MNNGKRITAFFLILLCLIFLSSGLFYRAAKKTQDPSLLRRNAVFMDLEKEPRESIDLLVLGDSESYTSISPMQVYNETGITTFVAGQSGQNMAEMYHMFETAMKTQTPKAIMIETHALIHSKGSAYDLQNMGTELAQTCFPVFSYHNLWKGRLAGESARVSAWKGFRVKSGVRACLDTKKYMKPTDHIRMVPSGNRAIFDKILKECKDKNIEVVLYSAPSPACAGERRSLSGSESGDGRHRDRLAAGYDGRGRPPEYFRGRENNAVPDPLPAEPEPSGSPGAEGLCGMGSSRGKVRQPGGRNDP